MDRNACYTLVDYEHMQNDTIRWERVASALGEILGPDLALADALIWKLIKDGVPAPGA